MIMRGLNEILMASANAKRYIPENAIEDLSITMHSILEEMLTIQNKIILSL